MLSNDQTKYEIFLSYARADNVPPAAAGSDAKGWVTALHDHILADHREFSTEPLRIFFDTSEISAMDDWEKRILGALRQSKILLVCLSPNYFASKYCKWEWRAYCDRQVHQLIGSEGIAPVYFVEAPGSNEQEIGEWAKSVFQNNFSDLRPWFPEGAVALKREEVSKHIDKLGESLWERIRRARRATEVRGNLRRLNEYFIGRNEELRQLHANLATGAIGLVAIVHGLGGQGKTDLTVAYAHGWADCYPVGLWVLGAEGKKELLPLLGELANIPEFGYHITEAERNDPNLLGRGVINELQHRAESLREKSPNASSAVLVILDNVSEALLLSTDQLKEIPRADWLRIIATTRLGREQLRGSEKSLGFTAVDSLDEGSALALIRERQPARDSNGTVVNFSENAAPCFASLSEEAAALDIVKELGGFTLAVEQVAVYLGLHSEIAPSAYLDHLRRRGLTNPDMLAKSDDVRGHMLHQKKSLSLILEDTLSLLEPPALTALQFASLLPPDCVPWPWLKALVIGRHPELAKFDLGEPNPWISIVRRLTGMRLLTDGDNPKIARIHRMVKASIRKDNEEFLSLTKMMATLITSRLEVVTDEQILSNNDLWELDALLSVLPTILTLEVVTPLLINFIISFTEKIDFYRDVKSKEELLQSVILIIKRHTAEDPCNIEWQYSLGRWYKRIGGLLTSQGDTHGALKAQENSLAIFKQFAASDPSDMYCQFYLGDSYRNIGLVLNKRMDFDEGIKAHQASLAIFEKLTVFDPSNLMWQNQLASSCLAIGQLLIFKRDFDVAIEYCEKSLVIRKQLAESNPCNREWQMSLVSSYVLIANTLLAKDKEDCDGVVNALTPALDIQEQLLKTDPNNQKHLGTLGKIYGMKGEVLRLRGDFEGALKAHQESQAISEQIAKFDPSNTTKMKELCTSYNNVGVTLTSKGDFEGALKALHASMVISEKLVASDPSNNEWQKSLLTIYFNIGFMLSGNNYTYLASNFFERTLPIMSKLIKSDPRNWSMRYKFVIVWLSLNWWAFFRWGLVWIFSIRKKIKSPNIKWDEIKREMTEINNNLF